MKVFQHLFHDWSKWSKPIDTAHDYLKVQDRYCKVCGLHEVRKMSQPFNLWFRAGDLTTEGDDDA